MTTEKIKIIAIVGKAGSGKDTIATALTSRFPKNFNNIVSCTTRPMREHEQYGVNYFYFTEEEFAERERNGDMLETTCFNNWHYGTALDCLSKDRINVGVFNPAGVRAILNNSKVEVVVLYVWAGAKTRLLRQLNREDNLDVKEIIRRFSTDETDFAQLGFTPDMEIENERKEDIDRAVDMLLTHVLSSKASDNFS